MKSEHISNIRKKNLLLSPRKYLWLQIPEEYSNINFSLLLDFIDKYSEYGKENKYGNAYYRIRKESNKLFGVGLYSPMKLKTSKREIKSIMNSVISKINGNNYIKISFKISYIFKAIITIIDNIKKDNNIKLPNSLNHTINVSYGIAFYSKYINVYDSFFDELQEASIDSVGYSLKVELNNDFHSESSIFNTIVS